MKTSVFVAIFEALGWPHTTLAHGSHEVSGGNHAVQFHDDEGEVDEIVYHAHGVHEKYGSHAVGLFARLFSLHREVARGGEVWQMDFTIRDNFVVVVVDYPDGSISDWPMPDWDSEGGRLALAALADDLSAAVLLDYLEEKGELRRERTRPARRLRAT